MKTFSVTLGLNEQLVITTPAGREIMLEWGTAEDTIRRMLRGPRSQAPGKKPNPEGIPSMDEMKIKRYTKSGGLVVPELSLEDLGF